MLLYKYYSAMHWMFIYDYLMLFASLLPLIFPAEIAFWLKLLDYIVDLIWYNMQL